MNGLRVPLIAYWALAFFTSCAAFAGEPRVDSTAVPGLADATNKPWTGDLEGMIERRMVRVLVVHSKTFYFLDKGAQRGLTHDLFKVFED